MDANFKYSSSLSWMLYIAMTTEVPASMAAFEWPRPIGLLLRSALGSLGHTGPCVRIHLVCPASGGRGWTLPVAAVPFPVVQLAEVCHIALGREERTL